MTHGPQRDVFDLTFSVPSVCADKVAEREVDLGILPVAEIQKQRLPYLPDVGIACRGAVRSILLISKVPPAKIRTLAADSSSRTSVMLTRMVLARKYGCRPELRTSPPDLLSMLEQCDAALIIGDPALRIEPDSLPYTVLDLGREWLDLTGLPMVFALWSGPERFLAEPYRTAFAASCRFGLDHLDDIVAVSRHSLEFPEALIRTYLTRHIVFELNSEDLRGLNCFWTYAKDLVV